MPKSTTFANGRGLVHKNSGGQSTIFPDVCLTPSGNGMSPVPYTNTGYSRDTTKGPTTVQVDGAMPMVRRAEYRRTYGDEPGTGGGVISGVHRGIAVFISYSFDVKLEGRNACRRLDLLQQNRNNVSG